MELWELAARESIRDLVARYNSDGDSGRIDAMLALFLGDAELEVVGSAEYHGVDEIRSLFEGAAAGDEETPIAGHVIRHHTATHRIDLEGATEARGRCYFSVYTEDGLDHWGRYDDRYHQVGGRWFFRSRRVTVEGRIAGGWGDRARARLHPDGEAR